MPRQREPSSSSGSRRRSPPRRSRRKDSRSRSRSGGRRGSGGRDGGRDGARSSGRDVEKKGGGGKDNDTGGKVLPEWGTAGHIQELKNAGIGFVRPSTGKVEDKDLFFHKSALKNGDFDELAIGDEVTYEAYQDDSKGKAAARNVYLRFPKEKKKKPSRRDDSRDASRDRRRR
mmetsp:Transcript_80014/g.203612  ORF Transcript_80014/g.203612 Transcript_80014/m.203612 type:complete len:173 (+) Transcript_80014:93-611(+)